MKVHKKRAFISALSFLFLSGCIISIYPDLENQIRQLRLQVELTQIVSIEEETTERLFETEEKESASTNVNTLSPGKTNTLMDINTHYIAWLKIPGTKINNPVVQTDNNTEYLRKDFHDQKSRYGTLFLDFENNLSSVQSQNFVIYGHNMKDGLMFGDLSQYKSKSFYQTHAAFTFELKYKSLSEYEIFSVFITSGNPDKVALKMDYRQLSFLSDSDFNTWLNYFKEQSLYDTKVDLSGTKQVITFSTCTYEFADARLVIMARKKN